jgi:hypothetical protein
VEEVVAEVQGLRSPLFAFWDDQLFMDRGYALRLFGALERLRRSGVRPLQSLALNWGYGRAIENALPGWPIPRGERSAALDWPGGASSVESGPDPGGGARVGLLRVT